MNSECLCLFCDILYCHTKSLHYIKSKRKGWSLVHTGGKYFEVPYDYRASQYDHTNGVYVKRKLSQRMFTLSDGTTVQRDLYSSFLLYNASFDDIGQLILDGIKCLESFAAIEKLHDEEIERIRLSAKRVLNSGIRV